MKASSYPLEGLHGPVSGSDLFTILLSLGEIVYRVDAETGAVDFVSSQAEEILGYSRAEFARLLEGDPAETVTVEAPVKRKDFMARCLQDPAPRRYAEKLCLRHKGGGSLWLKEKISPVLDEEGRVKFFVGSMEDITEQKLLDDGLKEALEEKEMLLKEVHHRVKNHLQMVSSLLDLATGTLKNSEDIKAFKDSQSRVRSIALAHEELYRSQDLEKVNVSDYLGRLVHNLMRSYCTDLGRVSLSSTIHRTSFNVNTAIHCGLIVNELVTNSLKHAFPQGREGEIQVHLVPREDGFEISVKDDGVGLPDNFDLDRSGTLGLQLVTMMAKQLDGHIDVDTSKGTAFKVTFPGR